VKTAFLCAIAVITLAAGCSSHSGKSAVTTKPGGSDQHYALLDDPSWTLQEARDLRADDPLASAEHPPVDWYDEYVRSPSASESQMVRISGHDTSFVESKAELEQQGFEFHEVPIAGRQAVGGTVPGDRASAVVLLLDDGPSSLVALTYDLSLDELVALAPKIEPASAAAWVQAGGVIS
jgi:hypothetical protein